jgi:hypothetical protein
MQHKKIAYELRHSQRDLLIEHVDGSVDVPVPVYINERTSARLGLIQKGLLRADRGPRPTKTIITEDGRMVLAFVLADYAETLLRAGYTGLASPVDMRPRAIAVESTKEFEPA